MLQLFRSHGGRGEADRFRTAGPGQWNQTDFIRLAERFQQFSNPLAGNLEEGTILYKAIHGSRVVQQHDCRHRGMSPHIAGLRGRTSKGQHRDKNNEHAQNKQEQLPNLQTAHLSPLHRLEMP